MVDEKQVAEAIMRSIQKDNRTWAMRQAICETVNRRIFDEPGRIFNGFNSGVGRVILELYNVGQIRTTNYSRA